VSKQSIIDRLRLELRDQAAGFEEEHWTTGESARFTLDTSVIRADDLVVTLDGDPVTDYILEPQEGVIELADIPAADLRLYVHGYSYRIFTDEEIEQFVDTAFVQHTHGRISSAGVAYDYTTIPPVEDHLIMLLALVQALWAMAADASQEIDVLSPDGVSIPEGQRFNQIMQMIQAYQSQYNDLAMALNVGLHRIEMFDLRRRSRTTNRLVPIYLEQEYDDTTWPVRVLPPIDRKV
jgi:hypothetical protein